MVRYCLSYIDKGIIKPIDISTYDILNGLDLYDLKTIDTLTMSFLGEEDLIKDLKMRNLIKNNTRKIYISKYIDFKKKILNIIYDGDILLFKKNKVLDYKNFIHIIYEEYKYNPKKLLMLAKLYLKKYKNNKLYESFVQDVYRYASLKIDTSFYGIGYISQQELEKDIERFKNKEYYKISKGKKEVKYLNFRDLVIKSMYVDGIYDIDRKHSNYLKYNNSNINDLDTEDDISYYEREEFLTLDDFKNSDSEIINNFNEAKFKGYRDGNDYVSSVSLNELADGLNDIAKKLVLTNIENERIRR